MTVPALSIEQARAVHTAASRLPPERRDRFRALVDDSLARQSTLEAVTRDPDGNRIPIHYTTDSNVEIAITRALEAA